MKTTKEVLEWLRKYGRSFADGYSDTSDNTAARETAAKIARAMRIAEAYDSWCVTRDTDRKIDGMDLLFDLVKKLGVVE